MIKRFVVDTKDEDLEGELVYFDDYQALRQRVDELEKTLNPSKQFTSADKAIAHYKNEIMKLQEKLTIVVDALKKINKEELNSQRPGGSHSVSARISYDTLKKLDVLI
jgi:uncharacterized coiled-coil protein SlyX